MFAENAKKYWEKGLPAMPLQPGQKIPVLNGWQTLCAAMPTEDQQNAWLAAYPDGNIGLPLGPQAGMIGLDLDSEDPRVQAILDRIMPISPWKRIGKKGAVYAFKYSGERTYRIKDKDNNTILEILSRGAQIVLPPSIHPDTQLPYVSNCELVDVFENLPALPADFENKVRQALLDAGFELSSRGGTKVAEWVPAGGRDSAMTSMAGLLARSVLRKERSLIEALNEIDTWVAAFTQKVAGDDIDGDRARKKVLEFLRRDIVDNKRQLPPGWDVGLTQAEQKEMATYFGDDAEEWPLQDITDHIVAQFQTIPRENTPARQAVVEDVLYRLSRSESLTSLDVEMVLATIQNASGRMINITALRKRLRDLQNNTGEMLGDDHTEIAQALLREMSVEGEIRYQAPYFYQWFGAYWRMMDEAEMLKRMAEDFGNLPLAKRFSDHKGILQVAQRLGARDLAGDDAPMGINFANGYLTDDLRLLPHEQRFGATYVLPYRYIPGERAPSMFMGFLDQCWGQDPDYIDKVQALREAIAATLFKRAYIYQRAFCLYGVAGSGKTTLAEIVKGLIPAGSISTVAPQDWADKFLPSLMSGRLVNFCGELSETAMISGAQFKMVVEGGELNGQLKGGQIFPFRARCAQWFASNHLPRSRDSSAGFNRRWLIWSFTRPVSADQKRVDLAEEIISEEREAIVAWAVPAILDLIRRSDYTLPASHRAQIEEVASSNNSVRFFLTGSEAVQLGEAEGKAEEEPLYRQYYAFCKLKANVPPVAMKRFRLMMQDLQADLNFTLSVNDHQQGSYCGLRLVERKK